jgi:hypothetical protein
MSSLHNHNESLCSLCDRFQDWLVDSTTPPGGVRNDGRQFPEAHGAGTTAQGMSGLGLPGTPPLELSERETPALEMAELASPGPRVAETCDALLEFAPAALREHAQACADCRDAADDLVTLRKLLRDLQPVPVAGPFFASRVMANIAAQESVERSRIAAVWLAVPRFASRLSWIAAATLVFACGWLYERPGYPPAQPQSASAFASEHLFDPPALPPNHDDVLVSLSENEQ